MRQALVLPLILIAAERTDGIADAYGMAALLGFWMAVIVAVWVLNVLERGER